MIGKNFITAGNATFVITAPNGDRDTWRVSESKAKEGKTPVLFVSLQTGSSNEASFGYVGILDAATGIVRTTAKGIMKPDHLAFRLLNRILARVWSEEQGLFLSAGYKLHHAEKCGRCGRVLTTPESCADGIGPECRKAMGLASVKPAKLKRSAAPRIGDRFDGPGGGVQLMRGFYTGD